MRPKTLAAGMLIALGIAAFAYQGISYRSRGRTVDVGPLHVTTEKTHSIPLLLPILGAIALVGGIALLMDGKPLSPAA